jgi:hypothetical protein
LSIGLAKTLTEQFDKPFTSFCYSASRPKA